MPAPSWTDAERAACVAFWNDTARERASLLPPRVTLTPEASLWFSALGRAVRAARRRRGVEGLGGRQTRP